ncbi:MAG: hypothetical protein QXX94_00385 [Candidatus Bathyarchaeia archaeon]
MVHLERVFFIDCYLNVRNNRNNLSTLMAAKHGDARRVLDLLRVAGEIAERRGDRKL